MSSQPEHGLICEIQSRLGTMRGWVCCDWSPVLSYLGFPVRLGTKSMTSSDLVSVSSSDYWQAKSLYQIEASPITYLSDNKLHVPSTGCVCTGNSVYHLKRVEWRRVNNIMFHVLVTQLLKHGSHIGRNQCSCSSAWHALLCSGTIKALST